MHFMERYSDGFPIVQMPVFRHGLMWYWGGHRWALRCRKPAHRLTEYIATTVACGNRVKILSSASQPAANDIQPKPRLAKGNTRYS